MAAIITIFVTVLANAIVTGIIVYRMQKNFEANLQKSLFEYQTRFSRNYEKNVETLENLYNKLDTYFEGIRKISVKFIASGHAARNELRQTIAYRFKDESPELEEFFRYFQERRLFLPTELIPTVMDIYFDFRYLHMLVPYAFQIDESKNPVESLGFVMSLMERRHLNISEINVENPDFDLLLKQILHKMEERVLTLELLYKSVAEAK